MVVGAAGGPTIPAQLVRVIVGVVDWDLSAQGALALPVVVPFGPEALVVEQGSALEAMLPALKALGHNAVAARPLPLKANAVEVKDGRLFGGADPRSEGKAVSE
jgi:gamma-glutamyltranspeptidase/glutathione hydrolase